MEKFNETRRKCIFHLSGHRSSALMKPVFQEITDSINDNEEFDHYGSGAVITNFEEQIAEVLGKEKAIFMPSGTMAQQIALRIW